MAGFEQQVKDRAKELKVLLKKGVKIVGDSCKKGWNKVKHIKRWLVIVTTCMAYSKSHLIGFLVLVGLFLH